MNNNIILWCIFVFFIMCFLYSFLKIFCVRHLNREKYEKLLPK